VDQKPCQCLDRVIEAAVRRREAEDAKRRAVADLHWAVVEAIDAAGCSHSQRAIAQAAGLSLGAVHNALLRVLSGEAPPPEEEE